MARRINPLFLGIGGVMLIYFGLISCKVVPVFHFKEAFIPKQHIQQDIQALSPLRAVQLLNWPLAKKKLLEKYPMIESLSISIAAFPTITIHVYSKQPWAMIINENQPLLFSYDGVLLNQNLDDIELPDERIMMVNSPINFIIEHRIKPDILLILQGISKGLSDMPLFTLQQLILTDHAIQLVEEGGLIIEMGTFDHIDDKFKMLKYFLGAHRNRRDTISQIDIRFPNRVIISRNDETSKNN
jgi:cell division septal protein FtsQ